MRAVVQRVRSASVTVQDEVIGHISAGLLVLVAIARGDRAEQADWLADKIVNLRIFEDEQGKMNRSLKETGGRMLIVSQFTLMGNCRKGRRPSFVAAAAPDISRRLYRHFIARVRESGIATAEGEFQTHMQVALVNDGPVTLVIDTP